jgi:3-phosphoshikimate 1-carboxyvinyltransferase
MNSSTWRAPLAPLPVTATVRLPGSKSMTNRALVLAALAHGRSTIRRPLASRDTALMAEALRSLGAEVDTRDDSAWTVAGGEFTDQPAQIDVGNAGTVLRFVPPAATLARAAIGFDGDPAVRRRPVAPLLGALRAIGAEIDDGGRGYAPFVVIGEGELPGGAVSVDASSSSQLVSALLLTGARYRRGIDIKHIGSRPVPNSPHLAMTTSMLRARGVSAEAETDHWHVPPGAIAPVDETVEPDLSSAAPFLAAAVVTGGEVVVGDWPRSSTQPGALLPELLAAFGASWRLEADGMHLVGGGTVTGADLDLRDAGELTPVLAAVASVATSPSRLTGVDYLRGHETDRLAALATELNALGADVTELADGLAIRPRPMHGGVFATYDDHRLAMAAAVIGLVVPDLEVENIETTAKTLPGFAGMWQAAVAGQEVAR